MVDQQDKPMPPEQQDDMADEYMHDEHAQQVEGKLAADKAQEHGAED